MRITRKRSPIGWWINSPSPARSINAARKSSASRKPVSSRSRLFPIVPRVGAGKKRYAGLRRRWAKSKAALEKAESFTTREKEMKIVHTMIRVNNLDESLKFYCEGLGMKLLRKREYPSGRFTNVFVGYGSEETDAVIELTYNWDTHAYVIGNAFGHIAVGVPDVYKACDELRGKGVKIVR